MSLCHIKAEQTVKILPTAQRNPPGLQLLLNPTVLRSVCKILTRNDFIHRLLDQPAPLSRYYQSKDTETEKRQKPAADTQLEDLNLF